jgi:hypothetical protein
VGHIRPDLRISCTRNAANNKAERAEGKMELAEENPRVCVSEAASCLLILAFAYQFNESTGMFLGFRPRSLDRKDKLFEKRFRGRGEFKEIRLCDIRENGPSFVRGSVESDSWVEIFRINF